MTPHISANKKDIASVVFLVGDPLRAKFMAETFMEEYRLVSSVRNAFFYTGKYKGKDVTIGTSGMGFGSISIYSYELFSFYEVDLIVRLGTAGSYEKELEIGSVIIAKESYSDNSYISWEHLRENINVLEPDKDVLKSLVKSAYEKNIKIKIGRIYSTDVFYSLEDVETIKHRSKAICVEMESFALFAVAKRLNKKSACILTVSDNLISHSSASPDDRVSSFKKMFEIAFDIL